MDDDFIKKVELQAQKEIREEKFKEAVENKKEQIKQQKPLMDIIFPWKITIKRKDKS